MDEDGVVYEPRLPQLLYLFVLLVFYCGSSHCTFTGRQMLFSVAHLFLSFSLCVCALQYKLCGTVIAFGSMGNSFKCIRKKKQGRLVVVFW